MTATMDRLSSLGLMLYVHHFIKFSQPLYERTKAVRANISQLTKKKKNHRRHHDWTENALGFSQLHRRVKVLDT